MSKRPQTRPLKDEGTTKPSALDGFEAPSDQEDPAILDIVERMVERRRQRLAEQRSHRAAKPGSRNRPA